MNIRTITIGFISLIIFSNISAQSKDVDHYVTSIKKWHKERDLALKVADGWLTVAGLYWLKEGNNEVGSAPDNDVQFPAPSPNHWGTIILKKYEATFIPNHPEINSEKRIEINTPLTYSGNKPTLVSHGSLQWHLLKRGEKIGIRLRDTLHPNRFAFDSVPYFEIDPTWKKQYKFIASEKSDSMLINNVLGMEFNRHPVGYIEISHLGKKHKLSLIDGGSKYFLIFSDLTTGKETYGGGRYLYIDKPTGGEEVIVDFNKAENPPCVFTKYATCLLPPHENKIPFAIEAGELYDGH